MLAIGPYVLTRELHHGGETTIYRGHRRSDRLPVVVKALRSRAPTAAQRARLRHEYAVLRGLSHPALVRALDFLESGGIIGLVMEDHGGDALSQVVRQRELDLKARLALAASMTEALAVTHDSGLVHRDIKPQNFLVRPDADAVVLIDFGLATRLSAEGADHPRSDAIEGTLAYISPEQTGRTGLPVDQRSDLYSLGVAFYQLFTGVHPFDTRDPLELIHCQIARLPPPMHERRPDLPVQLSRVVARLLAKDPDARYQTAQGLLADLRSCRRALEDGGELTTFPLGQLDRPATIRLPRQLIGRQSALSAALEAFDAVRRGRGALLALSGPAGIGKSALLRRLRAALVHRGAVVGAGKCDALGPGRPFGLVAAALRDLVRELLALPEATLAGLRERLTRALGGRGQPLVDLVPELDALLGRQEPAPALPPAEARDRLRLALQDLVAELATSERPLVLVAEDAQWADPASLELLSWVLHDRLTPCVLAVVTYRPHELAGSPPLVDLLQQCRDIAICRDLELAPLTPDEALAFVAAALSSAPEEVCGLAELAHAATGGNPFMLEQLLRSAHEQRLLLLDADALAWRWDAAAIAARLGAGEDEGLLLARFERLPSAAARLLPLAACIGHRFPLTLLAVAAGQPPEDIAEGLTTALDAGLIVLAGGDLRLAAAGLAEGVAYAFAHDRVQQAAHAALDAPARRVVHLRLGRFLREGPEGQVRGDIFDALAHLNQALDLIDDPDERAGVARLDLAAALQARGSGAFEAAAAHLRAGVAALPADAWTRAPDLAFALELESISADAQSGELAPGRLAALRERAADAVGRAAVDRLTAQIDTARGRPQEAIAAGLRGLAELGVALPADESACAAHVPAAMSRVREALAPARLPALLGLPRLREPGPALALQLLADLAAPANLDRPQLYALVIATQVELALRHGHAAISPYSYMVFAYVLATDHRRFDEALAIGRFALELLDRTGAAEVAAKTRFVFACFAHFIAPLPEVAAQFDAARAAARDAGDALYLAYACSHRVTARIGLGLPLDEVQAASDEDSALLERVRVASSVAVQRVAQQLVACMQGRTAAPGRLGDARFDEAAFVADARRRAMTFALRWYHVARLVAALHFRAPDAPALAEAAEVALAGGLGFYFTTLLPGLAALACLVGLRDPAGTSPRTAAALRHRAALAGLVAQNPDTYGPTLALVDAELARSRGDLGAAMHAYERALDGAEQRRDLALEALTAELAGEAHVQARLLRPARLYLRQAHAAYHRWGAHAKVQQLAARYEGFLQPIAERGLDDLPTWHLSSQGSGNLAIDLTSAFKAAQLLASEIVLERLLETVVPIAVENIGAERGALVLAEDGALRLAAAAGGADAYPEALVRVVLRTGAPLLLDDAAADPGAFRDEPYIRRSLPRSVLCAPLVHRGAPLGALYLENNLAGRIFTPQHLTVVQLLAAQAAIALANARLYAALEHERRTLEQRVHERTEALSSAVDELRATQRHLVESEKMAALGALVAGVAHEINTPVGVGVTAASALADRSEALARAYAAGSMTRSDLERYLEAARQSSAMILANLARAAELIQSFKQVAVDQSSADRRRFAVRAYLEALLVSLRPELRRTRHTVEIEGDPALAVTSDPGALSHIVTNLVMNSLQHAWGPGDTGHIRVAFAARGDALRIEYSDDGRGIAPEHLPRIFEPFFTTRRDHGGSGLGLHIVYNLVTQRLRGTIACESGPGRGVRFRIDIPLAGDETAS